MYTNLHVTANTDYIYFILSNEKILEVDFFTTLVGEVPDTAPLLTLDLALAQLTRL